MLFPKATAILAPTCADAITDKGVERVDRAGEVFRPEVRSPAPLTAFL